MGSRLGHGVWAGAWGLGWGMGSGLGHGVKSSPNGPMSISLVQPWVTEAKV